jgi:hypothetical protein
MPVCGDILHNYYINPGGWRNTTRRAHKCQPLLSLGSETASQHPPCWGHIDSERKFLYCGFYLLVSNVRIQTPAGIASKTGRSRGRERKHSDVEFTRTWRAWATPFERHKAGVLLGTRLKAAALAATLCLLQQHQLGGHHAVRHRTHAQPELLGRFVERGAAQ